MKKFMGCMAIFAGLAFSSFSQDVKDGYHAFYYENGKKSSEGYFKNGKPDGLWKSYYVSGMLKSEGIRKNSLLDSVWIFYDDSGDTVSRISYVNGKRNGYYLTYQKNDIENRNYLISKQMYLNDMLEGKSNYYYETGKIKSITHFVKGQKDGKEFVYGREGSIIAENNYMKGRLIEVLKVNRVDGQGRKDGLWREYYDNLRIKKEMHYAHGILNGMYKEYDANGELMVSLNYANGQVDTLKNDEGIQVEIRNAYYETGKVKFNGAFLKDTPVGIHRYFDQTGKVSRSEEYDNQGKLIGKGLVDLEGKRQGQWTNYYPDGSIKSKGSYKENLKEGNWEFYHENGQVEQKGSYKGNLFSGEWYWYYENGNLKREENYYLGKNDGVYLEYNADGKIIVKGEFLDGEKEGEWTYDVGDVVINGNYTLGLRDGQWVSYYEKGKLRFSGSYIQGNADGKHYLYYPNGNMEEERFFNSGYREKDWKKFHKDGTLKITVTYRRNEEIKINGVKIDDLQEGTKIL
jgi:uncharacterized protein